MDLKSLFTTDEEMEELQDNDPTTNIIGFVDTIMSLTKAGKENDDFFKFLVSNGNKRIPILIWGNMFIKKYIKDISSTRDVNINGGHCRAVLKYKIKSDNALVPFEILIKENTEICFLEYFICDGKTNNEFQKVTFTNIHTMEGLVQISGYIRTKFSSINTRSGLTTYALGAITDGERKITVQVKNFVESKLEIGDFVTVTGIIKDQDSLITVCCNSMNDIKYDLEQDALPPEKVLRGGRVIKRARTIENKS